jgi:hypothetical protein
VKGPDGSVDRGVNVLVADPLDHATALQSAPRCRRSRRCRAKSRPDRWHGAVLVVVRIEQADDDGQVHIVAVSPDDPEAARLLAGSA